MAYSELYRDADSFDIFLLVTATVAALGNGVIMPLFTIVMGGLVNAFNGGGDLGSKVTAQAVQFIYLAVGAGEGWGGAGSEGTNKLCGAYVCPRITGLKLAASKAKYVSGQLELC